MIEYYLNYAIYLVESILLQLKSFSSIKGYHSMLQGLLIFKCYTEQFSCTFKKLQFET